METHKDIAPEYQEPKTQNSLKRPFKTPIDAIASLIRLFNPNVTSNQDLNTWVARKTDALSQYIEIINTNPTESNSEKESSVGSPKEFIPSRLGGNNVIVVFLEYSDLGYPNNVMGIEQFNALPATRMLVASDYVVYPRDSKLRKVIEETHQFLMQFEWYRNNRPQFFERNELEEFIQEKSDQNNNLKLLRAIPYGGKNEIDELWINGLVNKYQNEIDIEKAFNQGDFNRYSSKSIWAFVYNLIIENGQKVGELTTKFQNELREQFTQFSKEEIEQAINLAICMLPQSQVAESEPNLLINQLLELHLTWAKNSEELNDIICFLKFSNTASGFGSIPITVADLNSLINPENYGINTAYKLLQLIQTKIEVNTKKAISLFDLGMSLVDVLRGATLQMPYNATTREGIDEISFNGTFGKLFNILITTKNITENGIHEGNEVNIGTKYLAGTIFENKPELLRIAITYIVYMFLGLTNQFKDENGSELNYYKQMIKEHSWAIGGFDARFQEVKIGDDVYLIPVITDENLARTTGNTAAHVMALWAKNNYSSSEFIQQYPDIRIVDDEYISLRITAGDEQNDFGIIYDSATDNLQRQTYQKQIYEKVFNQKVSILVGDEKTEEFSFTIKDLVYPYGFTDVKGSYGFNLMIPRILFEGEDITNLIINKVRIMIQELQLDRIEVFQNLK
jgi:hypothetical protein